ncbi:hypothetical protein OROMI_022584 [Orobanche minor]
MAANLIWSSSQVLRDTDAKALEFIEEITKMQTLYRKVYWQKFSLEISTPNISRVSTSTEPPIGKPSNLTSPWLPTKISSP